MVPLARRPLSVLSIFLVAATFTLVGLGAAYNKDPYKVLGIDKDADEASLKRAYKKLALKYHPDKNQGKGQAKFIEIQQAYEILSDVDKKREYDLGGGHGDSQYHHQGSSRHYHQQHQRQYHYYHYQQQQQYQQQQEQMHDRALPSNTTFLTTSNFRSVVFYGGRPWLMMVYTEDSMPCREFSATWEALWRSLGGSQAGAGNRDGASVGLGRIHARFQRSLVLWLMKSGGPISGNSIPESELPLLVAVPNGCAEASCFMRYRGPLRLSAIQDFVADRLLKLPKLLQLEPPGVPAFLRHASPYKVVVVAFGRGGGSGSLALRSLAARQKDMLTIIRAHVQETGAGSAAAWQSLLGMSSPPASGSVVFLRGPGTAPRVLVVAPGKTSELQQQIDEQGLLWQEVPPLRPATGASLGCLWGRAAAAAGRAMIDTCVIAVAPRGPPLEEARRRMAVLGRYLATQSSQRDASISATATAYMSGKLRLAWLDATAQQHLCSWLLGTPGAMRPTNTAPPPGTNAAGRAAAAAQAQAAAAAKSPELLRSVCGAATLDVVGQAREFAAAAAGRVKLHRLAERLRPRPTAHLMVLRPTVDGSSWFRGGHMRNGRPAFLFAVNADFDLSSPERSVDADLSKLAIWINQMHVDPDRQLYGSTAFPPALRQDDEPSALEFVRGRLYEGAVMLFQFAMSVAGVSSDGSSPLSAEMQAVNVAVVVVAMLLVHMAWWRRGDDAAAGRNNAAGGRRQAAARTAARVVSEPSPPAEEPAAGTGLRRRGRRSRSSYDGDHVNGEAVVGGRGRTSDEPAVNRRAQSPSWRSGRRGEGRDSADGRDAGDAVREETEASEPVDRAVPNPETGGGAEGGPHELDGQTEDGVTAGRSVGNSGDAVQRESAEALERGNGASGKGRYDAPAEASMNGSVAQGAPSANGQAAVAVEAVTASAVGRRSSDGEASGVGEAESSGGLGGDCKGASGVCESLEAREVGDEGEGGWLAVGRVGGAGKAAD